jgi:stage III sporulation protein AF
MGIVDFLKLWIRDIAFVFVIVSIIEIIIPNNNMKRYIDMVIGLLIIIVIITPFIKLLNKDFDIDKEIFKKEIEESKFVYKDNMNLVSMQEEQIKEVYLSKMEEEIKELIQETTNYKVDEISISIYEDELRYGDIKDIKLAISEMKGMEEKEKETKDIITIGNIEKITIGKEEEKPTITEEFDKGKEIKSMLSKNYNVPKKNIKIFLNTTGEGE